MQLGKFKTANKEDEHVKKNNEEKNVNNIPDKAPVNEPSHDQSKEGLHLNDNWNTPEETLKGVESYGMVSETDAVDSGIISIAREIQKDHSIDDVMTEQLMSSV
ncbi:hypothetical protein POM88_006654 [Heracleum sosnowskyi]|uniref:Uncharacterized protein n=1 Tax=Heracleum sosnowskyi TaxID=360622 RepID=A0AAD8J5V6_9APIA|nr:hypothetical protein POM88_006654 [Heracleum sosnowskyi]